MAKPQKQRNNGERLMTFVINTTKKDIAEKMISNGQNVLITGATGSGKSTFCLELAENLDMKPFMINFGSTQDARVTLIGSRELIDGNTPFVKSEFVNQIQQENTLIILDELSRGSDDAFNIVFPLLDFRKELFIDETGETIKIPDSVRFIATANVGSEYSATRSIDRALNDRFITFRLGYMNGKELFNYATEKFTLSDTQETELDKSCKVYDFVKNLFDKDEISTRISPRIILNTVGLLEDFTYAEVFDNVISCYFEEDTSMSGELNSIRMFMDSNGIK